MNRRWTCLFVVTLLLTTSGKAFPQGKQGGLVLQFDDGWTSWATLIAPELERVGGKATGFINNQHLQTGRISANDLLELQNRYGWEIGTHSFRHVNAPQFTATKGVDTWVKQELLLSIEGLRATGLNVHALAFPYNAFTPALATAVSNHVSCFRRDDPLALASGIRGDKTIPGTAIDAANYVPLSLVKKWIDMAQKKNILLFLYGHQVLPDDRFFIGTIKSAGPSSIVSETPVPAISSGTMVLVPDITRRWGTPNVFYVTKIEGNSITVDRQGLSTLPPGTQFMIGEAYGTRISYLKELLQYASERVNFYTVNEAVKGIPQPQASGITNALPENR